MLNINQYFRCLRFISFILLYLIFAAPVFSDTIGYFSQNDVLEPQKTKNNIVLIDVRTPGEFNSGRVPKSINIPLAQLSQRLDEVLAYKNKNIVLYCRSGRRAGIAARIVFQATGIEQLYFLKGDMNQWVANNKPLER